MSRGAAVFPGVVGGSSQVYLAGPYMILYRVDRGRSPALLHDLGPSPGGTAESLKSFGPRPPRLVRSRAPSHRGEPMGSACGRLVASVVPMLRVGFVHGMPYQ